MKRWISFPKVEGTYSKQAHCDLPEGTYEREFGKEGFFGPVTHIHHTHMPTGWEEWEGDLKPRAFDTVKMDTPADCPLKAPVLLHNAHFQLRIWKTSGKMDHLVSNASGDDLLFVHAGSGEFFCDFGHLSFREGDYIMLPRSTMWRVECHEPSIFLMTEATNDSYRLPDKGMLGENAIFDPAALDTPKIDEAFKAQQGEHTTKLVVKRGDRFAHITYPFNPLDAAGWHGNNLPVRINWRDIRPVMSHRYHLPPSVHTTFLASRFVVCTFCPRPIESDPGALKVPFFHSNTDYDEILFYHAGDFFSRDNIHAGMVSFHPTGFPHGPHPKAFAAGAKATKTHTDEVAVMIDTRDAVQVGDAAKAIEWQDYVYSWKKKD
ncbi:MAG: homogentisate 1,2-dioxygenase [Alphaproteobacteria bacterium]|nr:homogentisate 1,2-dioxygenase [Alphaproteobacteria bacterium]